MRAFVTGGTGFVGIHVVRELVAAGWDVVVLRRKSSEVRWLSDLHIAFAEGDVTDLESLRRAVPMNVDAVFNVAGDTTLWSRNFDRQYAVNVTGVKNMAKVALEKRAGRFVLTSSIAAFGRHPDRIDEQTPSIALTSARNYDRTKRLGELEVEEAIESGLDAVIVNPANVVGEYDTRNWARLVVMVARGELPGVPPGRASWAHGREVARAHIAAAERGRTGERYLLGGVDASYLQAVQTIGAVVGKKVPNRPTPAALLLIFGAVSEAAAMLTRREPKLTRAGARLVSATQTCDSSKAIRELGYRAAPLEEMFGDCYGWLEREGLL